MSNASVSAGFARGLVNLAVSLGARENDLVSSSGVSQEVLCTQDERIPFPQYVALFRAAVELTREPALALHYGTSINFNDVSIVGLVCEAAETMREAIIQLNRYVRLIVDIETEKANRFEILRIDDAAWFIDTRTRPNDFFELSETALAQFASGVAEMGGGLVKSVHFTHAAPSYVDAYERTFKAPLTFEAKWNAVQFDPALLDYQVGVLPRYVFAVLSAHADELLRSLEDSQTIRGRVESTLASILHTGSAKIEHVATALGLSSRSLQRKLHAEGASFEVVLDELRHRLALHYLSRGAASIHEVAYLVGFSDPAAFSRAFKRWTGRTPREARAAI